MLLTMRLVLLFVLSLRIWTAEGNFTAFMEAITAEPADPDADRSVIDLIESKGYPAEKYTIQTKDGFLLGLHRIPQGRFEARSSTSRKPAILLCSSLFATAAQFVLNFPHQSLGFILADAGYDVWLSNSRGTKYSQRHLRYTVNDTQFWDFSFEEIGTLDMSAGIDYILMKTGEQKLFLVGYSMSTTSILSLLSLKPDYCSKVRAVGFLGPIAFVSFTTSPIRILPYFQDFYYPYFNQTSAGEFMRPSPEMVAFQRALCRSPFSFFCSLSYELFVGPETLKQFNRSRVAVYINQGFSSSSSKNLVHFGQNQKAKRFARFDYGPEENLRRYGTIRAPDYPVWKINCPVSFLLSEIDVMADAKDVSLLRPLMSNSLVAEHTVPASERFTHIDFALGMEANRLVYYPMMNIMSRY